MYSRVLSGAALVAALSGVPAIAADMPFRRGPDPAPVWGAPVGYNWTGFHIGANLGYAWGDMSRSPLDPAGLNGGVQAGYNAQFDRFVIGAETDLQLADIKDRLVGTRFEQGWFGTLRGRAGFAFENVLAYGTFGLAYGNGDYTIGAVSDSRLMTGWTFGGGVEVGLARNWTVKGEYLRVNYGDELWRPSAVQHGFDTNVFRLGTNYRF